MEGQTIIKMYDENNYAKYHGKVDNIREIDGEKFGTWNGNKVIWNFSHYWFILSDSRDDVCKTCGGKLRNGKCPGIGSLTS